MKDEELNNESKKFLEAINSYIAHVAFTNPEQLPAAMSEAMSLMMRFKMQQSVIEFMKAFSDKLDKITKGGKKDE